MEKGGFVDLIKLFEDQRTFNRQIFDPTTPGANLLERLRNLGLGAIEEVMEFLRTYEYKPHRRYKGRLQNVAHSHEELIDLFKFWLSMADASGFDMSQLEELYYAKSRVVRYRFQEEWAAAIDRPCVIVDIDGVLADYLCGFCSWAKRWGPRVLQFDDLPRRDHLFIERVERLQLEHAYINADALGVSHDDWRKLKHNFRINGEKRRLPVYPDAKEFLEWCRGMGYLIVLVTSRPIDEYPNLFTDTMTWLVDNGLEFDYLWWATEKAERIENGNVLQHTVFAVDDDLRYVQQFRKRGVRTYELLRGQTQTSPDEGVVGSLRQIMKEESLQPRNEKLRREDALSQPEDLDE